jgi:hypothetical protein
MPPRYCYCAAVRPPVAHRADAGGTHREAAASGLQANGLRDSQPSGVTGGQNHAMFEALHTAKKMQNLLGEGANFAASNLLEGPCPRWPTMGITYWKGSRANARALYYWLSHTSSKRQLL